MTLKHNTSELATLYHGSPTPLCTKPFSMIAKCLGLIRREWSPTGKSEERLGQANPFLERLSQPLTEPMPSSTWTRHLLLDTDGRADIAPRCVTAAC